MPSLSSRPTDAVSAPRRKSTLFCSDCGHESRVDGDWDLQATADGVALRCPECGALLTTRPPTHPVTHAPTPAARATPTPTGGTRSAVAFAVAVTAWPCDVHQNPSRARP